MGKTGRKTCEIELGTRRILCLSKTLRAETRFIFKLQPRFNRLKSGTEQEIKRGRNYDAKTEKHFSQDQSESSVQKRR